MEDKMIIYNLSNEEKEQKLKNLLLSIDEELYQKVEEDYWGSGFNVFDVLNVVRTEIRHSNVLAWLLDPSGSHGLADGILRGLNKEIAKQRPDLVFDLLLMDCSDAVVYRESHNIDILVVSKMNDYILCIENKIDSDDHDNQLEKYYNYINKEYPNNNDKKVFLYLTPDGRPPIQDEDSNWLRIGYEDIEKIIKCELKKEKCNGEVRSFIENYIRIIRRDIMTDEKIVEICQRIYKEHKEALDLIFDNKPDNTQAVAEICRKWCNEKNSQKEIIFDDRKNSKKYFTFRTAGMNQYFDDNNIDNGKQSYYGTKYHYTYEIEVFNDKKENICYKVSLSLNSTNLDDEDIEKLKRINTLYKKSEITKDKWQFRRVFSETNYIKQGEDIEDSEEKIMKKLDKVLKAMKEKEVTMLKVDA